MRYSDIAKKVISEDATCGATAAGSVATVTAPFFTNPEPKSKDKKKKVTVVKRK
jgi:hypothetical protein